VCLRSTHAKTHRKHKDDGITATVFPVCFNNPSRTTQAETNLAQLNFFLSNLAVHTGSACSPSILVTNAKRPSSIYHSSSCPAGSQFSADILTDEPSTAITTENRTLILRLTITGSQFSADILTDEPTTAIAKENRTLILRLTIKSVLIFSF